MKYEVVHNRDNHGIHWRAIVSGVVFIFLVSLIFAGVMAVTVYFSKLTDDGVVWILYTLGILSVVLGGAFAGRCARRTGWLHGGLTGIVYVAVALLFMAANSPEQWHFAMFMQKIVIAFAVGAIGGAIGVNY